MASALRKVKHKAANNFQLSNRNSDCNSVFTSMPAEIFFKVCSYLDLRDICRIGRVCVRWYLLTRSEFVWHRTDIAKLILSPEKTYKLLSALPSCVEKLRVGNCSSAEQQTLYIPKLFYELRDRCPQLNVLVIENSTLTKPTSKYLIVCGYVLNCQVPERDQVIRYFNELKSNATESGTVFQPLYLLSNLTVLSLRKCLFDVNDIFPTENCHEFSSKIKILDVTLSLSATDKAVGSFCRLRDLEEIYLSETAITVNGVLDILESLRNLKVLDLDRTVVGGETFLAIKNHGKNLTELYMGGTALKDDHLMEVDKGSFPELRQFCLKDTHVTETGVQILLDSLCSLACVNIIHSNVSPEWFEDQSKAIRRKLKYYGSVECDKCDHFFEKMRPF